MPYVDLSRRFRDLTKDELEAPEILAWMNEASFMPALDWTELLDHPRLLLLAEAGSGKTAEMRAQAARLTGLGKPAFFVPLEALARVPLEGLLETRDRQALEAWKGDGHSTAWFFLDSVDELKLVQGKLERTLARLASTIDDRLHRAHVVISSRPTDWRPIVDMTTFEAKLPIVPAQPVPAADSDEAFLAALREQGGGQRRETHQVTRADRPRAVVLLPLGEPQIVTLARSLGLEDPAALLVQVRRQGAWNFARRPLDLTELVQLWQANGRLGPLAELHSANVTVKLKDDPERPDRGVLSDERARSGAERLALALALTRSRTIRSPEQALSSDHAEGVLDSAQVLTDWTPEERQALLRRPLFDPATYGRVRFHHSSAQEYLAARRLAELRKKGMPWRSLRRLMFAERYAVPLVIPSMQAIAAWLALWDEDVRRELRAREPETLVSMGDPESLPIPARAQLLRAFARRYGEGGRRGLNVPPDQVHRLAHPDLAPVIHELWDGGPRNPELTDLLLEMIWQGRIDGCADIASAVASDKAMPDDHRMIAIKALAAVRSVDSLRKVSDSLLCEPASWPGDLVPSIIGALFPAALAVEELMVLLRRAAEPVNTVNRFSWAVSQIVGKVELSLDPAVELRDALADLILRGRHQDRQWFPLRGRFDALAPALAQLCSRLLDARAPAAALDARLIWACVVANRFTDTRGGVQDALKLKRRFQAVPSLRQAAFWQELKLISEVVPARDASERRFQSEYQSLIEPISAADRPWLLEALQGSADAERGGVALHALVRLWRQHGRPPVELHDLQAAVNDDPDLAEQLRQETRPPEPDTVHERWELEHGRRHQAHREQEDQRLDGWRAWQRQLRADPDAAFTREAKPATARNLFTWLEANYRGRSRFSVWDTEALRKAFGDEITARAAMVFREIWRAHTPVPWSRRPPEDRDTVHPVWIQGLTGLAVEATSADWATRLTADEARVAAAFALIEINGFPSWLKDLAAAQPAAVDAVVGAELTEQLTVTQEHTHLPTLQNLGHADQSLKRLLAPRLRAAVPGWPAAFQDDTCRSKSEHHLDSLFGILDDVLEPPRRAEVARICGRQFLGNASGPLALSWLQGLFRFDPEAATHAMEQHLAALPELERSHRAVAALASLFGHHAKVAIADDHPRRAALLGRLVRCAYRYVRSEEDQVREGESYVNVRTNAEAGRNALFASLRDTPGAEAYQLLRDLAIEADFAGIADHLCFLARRRAATDAEGPPFLPADIVALEKSFEAPPHDRDGLFTVMVDRLDDLAHDIAHDDLSGRRLLRTIKEEPDMQRELARRLRDSARDVYKVVREDEVVDLKEPDIRLFAVRGDQKAVIEVKIAAKWSLAQLERALRIQLVAQYLRHDTCKAGCLLLTFSGEKTFWLHGKRRLRFDQMVEHLQRLAVALEAERAYEIRLVVYPLDLTDPVSKA